jgi:hypothetical protein
MAALAIVAVAFWAFLKFVSTLDENTKKIRHPIEEG